jgi:hypothetical protein
VIHKMPILAVTPHLPAALRLCVLGLALALAQQAPHQRRVGLTPRGKRGDHFVQNVKRDASLDRKHRDPDQTFGRWSDRRSPTQHFLRTIRYQDKPALAYVIDRGTRQGREIEGLRHCVDSRSRASSAVSPTLATGGSV